MLLHKQLRDILDTTPALDTVWAMLQALMTPDAHFDNFTLMRMRIDRTSFKGLRLLYKASSRNSTSGDCYVFARTMCPSIGRPLAEEMNHQFSRALPTDVFPDFSTAAVYSVAANLLLQVFPADNALPFLAQAADPKGMQSVLQTMRRQNREGWMLVEVKPSLVQYEPEKKCLFRYELHWHDRRGGGQTTEVLYGKVFRKFAAGHKNLASIYTACQGTVFQIPEPMGMVPELSMQLIGSLPGMCLSHMCSEKHLSHICRQVARGLLEFHHTPIVLYPEKGLATVLSEVQKWTEEFAMAVPGEADRIRHVCLTITKALHRRASTPVAPVHGDFNAANILVDCERLGLLDFDHCYMGSPGADVGSFYGELKLLALNQYNDPTALDRGIHAFIQEYMSGCAPDLRDTIPAYCALSCLWCAYFQCILRPLKHGSLDRALLLQQLGADILEKGAVR